MLLRSDLLAHLHHARRGRFWACSGPHTRPRGRADVADAAALVVRHEGMAYAHRRLLHLFATALPLAACGDDNGRDSASASATTLPSTTVPSTSDPTTATTTAGPTSTTDAPTEGTASASATDGGSTDGVSAGSSGGTTGGTTGPGTTGPMPCPEDQVVCDGNTAQVCDGMGGFKSETPCPKACAPGLGCVECEPGSAQCNGQVSQVCKEDGSGFVDTLECDPLQGMMCDPNSGLCTGACANLGGLSYIGCDYYPVVTQQLDFYVGPNNPYAVAVANTTADNATITVTKGGAPVLTDMVPANSVKAIPLPWVNELALGTGPTSVVPDGAYRLRSTQPVTVYQFNPLNADVTNDASLMLPVNTWTGNYVVAAWPFWNDFGGYPGWYSVTARYDNTKVTVQAAKGGTPTQAGAGVDGQGNGVVMLNEGDVLQVFSTFGGDGTGTFVAADKPVQVLGGHECTQVPFGITACDHLEESIFPFETLAREYIVVPPAQANGQAEKAVVVRIIAAEADTVLTFEPDQPVNKNLANVGDFVEIPTTTAKFVVKSDKKLLVAEYMVGQDAGFGTSDPAMVLAVPSEQFRTNYLFYAQPNWSANFVDIIAPTGANVMVDGAGVGNFTPIGATGFSLAHVALSNGGGGNHSVTADQKVGISVYGVLDYGSYWYPGGLDLALIPQ